MTRPLDEHLAAYAIRSCDASSRAHTEPDDPLRSPFELDKHRIIASTAFRRLEGKTQVFAASRHDHFRTRLTHTLEAAHIAACLAQALRANAALCEAITLAHDLGHPPFGHAGEAALDEATKLCGGFNHNLHALRVVESLEHPFPPFRGLNLTAETRAGLSAHATRYDRPDVTNAPRPPRGAGAGAHEPPQREGAGGAGQAARAGPGPSVEAQIASVADRIAYNCHDLEDAVGAGFIDLDQLDTQQLWQTASLRAAHDHPEAHLHAIRRTVLDTMLDTLLADVIETSRSRLATLGSPRQMKATAAPAVRFSDCLERQLCDLESFLSEHVYEHAEVTAMDARGRETISALFEAYRSMPEAMPARFADRVDRQGLDRVICDYIAGMTDRYCTLEYARVTVGRVAE